MLAGVNMIDDADHVLDDAEQRYLRRFLETARTVQSSTQFVVFTSDPGCKSVGGWETVQVDPHGGMFGALPVRGSALDHALRRSQVEVVLSPLDAAPAVSAVPQVLLAMQVEAWEPEHGAPQKRSARLKAMKRACASARAVVATSEHLRKRCLELLDVPLDKSLAAPAGVDAVFEGPQAPMVGPPYLLLFRDAATASQLPRIFPVFTAFQDEFPHTLVIAGARRADEPGDWGPNVVRIEQCPDTALAGLYQHCSVFIQPSVHDGHAMRVLEAIRAGACVISPHARAVEELAGDAPFYYNWESGASLLAALRRALGLSPEQRQERTHLGRLAISKYAWDKSAWKILAALKR
jgi:hypothetical protein